MSMEAALYHGPDKGITVGTTPKPTPWKGEHWVKIEAAGDVQSCISGQVCDIQADFIATMGHHRAEAMYSARLSVDLEKADDSLRKSSSTDCLHLPSRNQNQHPREPGSHSVHTASDTLFWLFLAGALYQLARQEYPVSPSISS